MNIGIYARYQPCDVTYAAIQIADLAQRHGNQVAFLTPTPKRPPVHARWDDQIIRAVPFMKWAENLDLVIWLECPTVEPVRWCQQPRGGTRPGTHARGRTTVLVSSWNDTEYQVSNIYPIFTHVVAPSRAAYAYLTHDIRLENVRLVPWSPQLPIIIRSPLEPMQRPSLHFPLCDCQSRDFDPMVIDLVERLLRHKRDIDLHVSLNGRSGEVVRRLERRAREYANLTMVKCSDFEPFVMKLSEHDLTVILATSESFGMTALCSLHAGTPVIAYAVPPLDEFVVHNRHGILVSGTVTGKIPGTADNDWNDQMKFENAMLALLDQRERLAALRMACTGGLEERAIQFGQGWTLLFSET
jgi:hypothetical protein